MTLFNYYHKYYLWIIIIRVIILALLASVESAISLPLISIYLLQLWQQPQSYWSTFLLLMMISVVFASLYTLPFSVVFVYLLFLHIFYLKLSSFCPMRLLATFGALLTWLILLWYFYHSISPLVIFAGIASLLFILFFFVLTDRSLNLTKIRLGSMVPLRKP